MEFFFLSKGHKISLNSNTHLQNDAINEVFRKIICFIQTAQKRPPE